MTIVIAAERLERIDQMVRWIGQPSLDAAFTVYVPHPVTRECENSQIAVEPISGGEANHRYHGRIRSQGLPARVMDVKGTLQLRQYLLKHSAP